MIIFYSLAQWLSLHDDHDDTLQKRKAQSNVDAPWMQVTGPKLAGLLKAGAGAFAAGALLLEGGSHHSGDGPVNQQV